jgi:hypothetical protein
VTGVIAVGKKKKPEPKKEWIDPNAPTELLGETNAVFLDLVHHHMQNRVDDLVDLGMKVNWVAESEDEPAHYELTATETLLEKVAKAAYDLGRTERDARAYKEYLDELLENYSNAVKSSRVRRQSNLKKGERVILALAEMLKTGDVSKKALAGELGLSLPTVYRYVAEFRNQLLKAARPFTTRNPSASPKQIEEWLVERFAASTPGVTRLTVREALKRERSRGR